MGISKVEVLAKIDVLKSEVEAMVEQGEGELIAQLQAQVADLQAQVAAKDVQISDLQAQVSGIQVQVDALSAKVSSAIAVLQA
jgi:phage shock protein A